MENRNLRVLVVDDSPDDAELPIQTLRDAGYRVKSQRVYNLTGMESMLQKEPWDIVLSEYSLLQFSAQMCLDLLRRKNLDTPLLVLTRSISDRDFAEIVSAGARDVIRKNYSTRLIPAIERELDVVELKRQLKAAQNKVAEMEGQNSAIVSGTQEAVCYCHDGMHIKANQAYLTLFGYTGMDELETIPVLNLIQKKDQAEFKNYLKKAARNQAPESPLELGAICKDGKTRQLAARFSTVSLNNEDCIQITFDDISQRKATEDRLQFLTQRDPLTGLYNRHFFGTQLTRAWKAARDGNAPAALIYFNLVQLREINSKYGFTVGDGILLKVAKTLREHLGEDRLLARFGDEEITVLLEGNDAGNADALAKELEDRIHGLSISAGNKKVNCKAAVAVVPVDELLDSGQAAISRALELTAEQRKPAASPTPAAPEARPEEPAAPTSPELLSMEAVALSVPEPEPQTEPAVSAPTPVVQEPGGDAAIAAALANDGFRLVYQPIVSLAGEADELFEVLVRMVGPNGELVPPRDFMPAAQKSGQIAEIDSWVAQRTIESLAAMKNEGRKIIYFVNVSVTSLRNKDLAPQIMEGLKSHGLDARQLVLEFSQNEITDAMDELTTFATAMRKIGCRLSIDNAGAVADILAKLPPESVHYLKFDGNVVKELMKSKDAEALESVMETARQLGIRTVATHIEDAESLADIWSRGFDYVQGHYFQQPETELTYEFSAGDEATLATDEVTSPPWSVS